MNTGRIEILEIKEDFTIGKVIEISKEEIKMENIADIVTFGNKMVLLSVLSEISYLNFNLDCEESPFEISFNSTISEELQGNNLAICEKSEYVFVSLRNPKWKTDSIKVFKISENELNFLCGLSLLHLNLNVFGCFASLGYLDDSLLLATAPCVDNPSFHVFQFRIGDNEIKEIEELREELDIKYLMKFTENGEGDLVAVSRDLSILSVSFN